MNVFDRLVAETASRFNLSPVNVSSLLHGVLTLVMNERTGGPEGFVDLFRRVGLGDVLTSWFGGRAGRSMTPAQLESALGATVLDRLADSSGLTRASAASALAFLLPRLFGRLTPTGLLPSSAALRVRIDDYLRRPAGAADYPPTQRLPPWLPWAALAVMAVTGLFLLSGFPG